MASIIITPWRNHDELLEVRRWLYASNRRDPEPNLRRQACSQIQAWKLRGRLPHAVESTWFITDAILTDSAEESGISALAIRLFYSTAICRFVTGLLDSEQDSKYKISMYDKAKQLELPASFVELRHEAIHGELPSLVFLRQAAERALGWLWSDYWQHLDENFLELGGTYLSDGVKEILESHVTGSSEVSNAPQRGSDRPSTQGVTATTTKLMEICQASNHAISKLINILVIEGMLLPRDAGFAAEAGDDRFRRYMDDLFMIWDQLLKELAAQHDQFSKRLTDVMVAQLITPEILSPSDEMLQRGVFAWLEHIYTSPFWDKTLTRNRLDSTAIVTTCLQNPNRWTISLASLITQNTRHTQSRQFSGPSVVEAMEALRVPQEGSQEQGETADTSAEDGFDGWQRSRQGWTSTPIGVS